MDFGTLKQKTRELLGREVVSIAFDMATAELNRDLRIIAMEKAVTLTAQDGKLTLPKDFREPQLVRNLGGKPITPISFERLSASTNFVGAPQYFALGNGEMWLNPTPEDGHEIELVYFADLTPLVDENDTNTALSGGGLEAYVYAVLTHHARLIRDAVAKAEWEPEAKSAIALANRAAIDARFNGGTIQSEHIGTMVA